MICPKCGRKYDNNTVFCTYCGTKCISDSEMQPKVQETEKTENRGANKALIGIAVAIGVVCVVLLVTCVSLLFFKGKSSDANNKADSKTEKTEDKTEEQEPDVDKYSVTLLLVDSTTVSSENGTTGNAIPSANIYIREGADSYSGDIIQTVTTDEGGRANMDLESGTYTAQIGADGYSTMYYAVEVGTDDVSLNCYAAPVNNDNKKTIVLTWDNPDYDLDLTIFTPYQDSKGDTAYIGSGLLSDSHGNYIESDNSTVCEVAYIDGTDSGDYKIYVNNYTDTQSGNLNSSALGEINAHVYVYADNEQVADYTAPVDTSGIVWEVAQISGTTYQPCQLVYNDVSGNKCWNRDKNETLVDWEAIYAEVLTDWDAVKAKEYCKYSWYDYKYIYLDDDEIPELCIACEDGAFEGWDIYTIVNGEAVHLEEYNVDGVNQCSDAVYGLTSPGYEYGNKYYISNSGIFIDQSGVMGTIGNFGFQLIDGKLREIFYFYHIYDVFTDETSYTLWYKKLDGSIVSIEGDGDIYFENCPEMKEVEKEYGFSLDDMVSTYDLF